MGSSLEENRKELFRAVIQVYEGKHRKSRHLHINYGHEIEHGIKDIQRFIKGNRAVTHIPPSMSTRYIAIKLLEGDTEMEKLIARHLPLNPQPSTLNSQPSSNPATVLPPVSWRRRATMLRRPSWMRSTVSSMVR